MEGASGVPKPVFEYVSKFTLILYRYDEEKYREEMGRVQQALLWRRFFSIIFFVSAFWWFMFVFNNAYKPPPGYVMYKDSRTGEMMYVHHTQLNEVKNRGRGLEIDDVATPPPPPQRRNRGPLEDLRTPYNNNYGHNNAYRREEEERPAYYNFKSKDMVNGRKMRVDDEDDFNIDLRGLNLGRRNA